MKKKGFKIILAFIGIIIIILLLLPGIAKRYIVNHSKELTHRQIQLDNLTGKPFNYHLNDIVIQTDSIFSDSEWVELHARMLLNNRGTLKADLGLNPLNPDGADL